MPAIGGLKLEKYMDMMQPNPAMAKSCDRYVNIFDATPLGFVTLSSDGLIEKISLTGASLLGVERKDLLQKRFSIFVVDEEQDRWNRNFLSMKRQIGQGTMELALQRGDGTVFLAELACLGTTGDPLDKGSDKGIRITLSDISE